MKVELIDTTFEITHDNVLQYLSDCASVVRDAQPKSNERLFNRLSKESYGNKPSRVFEYVACIIDEHKIPDMNQYFGHYEEGLYYTNARELFRFGWTWEAILEVVDFTHYKAVKSTTPWFIQGHLQTHNQITTVSHSNRYTQSKLGYWKPDGVNMTDEQWQRKVEYSTPKALEAFMKVACNIKRREVYARGSDMLEYRVSTLGGYTNNVNA